MSERASFTSLAAAAASTATLRSLMEEFIGRVNVWRVCWQRECMACWQREMICVIDVHGLVAMTNAAFSHKYQNNNSRNKHPNPLHA